MGLRSVARRVGQELADLLDTAAGDAILAAHSSASSREGASMIETPPMYALPGATSSKLPGLSEARTRRTPLGSPGAATPISTGSSRAPPARSREQPSSIAEHSGWALPGRGPPVALHRHP